MVNKESCAHDQRKLAVARNLRRIIKAQPHIRTIANFSQLHGCDIRTAKTWLRYGIDRLTTVSEVARTLGVSDLELILIKDEAQ